MTHRPGHTADVGGEAARSETRSLSRYPDPALELGHEAHGGVGLDVLGKEQQTDGGRRPPERGGGVEPLGRPRRRHADVDDGHVRLARGARGPAARSRRPPDRRRRTRHPAEHAPRPLGTARRRPRGSRARDLRTEVRPAAPRAGHRERPVQRGEAIRQPLQAAAPAAVGSTAAVVDDLQRETVAVDPAERRPRGMRSNASPRSSALRSRRSSPRPRRRRKAPRRSTSIRTGTGQRSARKLTAASRPSSVSTAGWIPRAISRSSDRASASWRRASATPVTTSGNPVSCARCSTSCRLNASVTSRCWAPSWRSRSMRRRAPSCATTIRFAAAAELGRLPLQLDDDARLGGEVAQQSVLRWAEGVASRLRQRDSTAKGAPVDDRPDVDRAVAVERPERHDRAVDRRGGRWPRHHRDELVDRADPQRDVRGTDPVGDGRRQAREQVVPITVVGELVGEPRQRLVRRRPIAVHRGRPSAGPIAGPDRRRRR